MNKFGDRIRELRKAKGYSLRQLAPLVGVGFSYLSKVERGRLDFDGTASESLVHRLATVLESDKDELLMLAGRIPEALADRIREQPEVFRVFAQCDSQSLSALKDIALQRRMGTSEQIKQSRMRRSARATRTDVP